jgi:gliding motility-associated-like protein
MRTINFLTVLSTVLFATGLFAQSNNCATATPLDLSSGSACFNGTNSNATSALLTNACSPNAVNEVWFTYTVTNPNNQFILTPGSLQNPVITVSSTGCGSGVLDFCESATGSNTINATWGFAVGQQVIISVASNSLTDGTFELCINSFQADPSGGNTCAGAIQLCDINSPLVFNMSNLNASGTQPSCFLGSANQDAWLTFTVYETGTLAWTATASNTGSELDWVIYDVTMGCLGNLVACNYNYGGANSFSVGMDNSSCVTCPTSGANQSQCAEYCAPITVTAGNTYAIMIDLYSGGAGEITFNFTSSMTAQIQPIVDFSINPSGVICDENLVVNITDNSVGSAEWSFGNGNTYSGNNPPNVTYTEPGTYAITAVIGGACPSTNTEYVQLFGPVSATFTSIDETCLNDCDGSINLFPIGGSGTYNYSWNDGATASNRTDLCAGDYSVTITDPICNSDIVLSIGLNEGASSDASFSYDAAAYCVTGTNPSPIINGDPGGTFSGSGTLVIDANTGIIDLVASGTGNYVVTYSVGGTCPASLDVNVQITNGFDATFNYNPPYCAEGTASISLGTGASTGEFSAVPAGLSINSSTGEVNLENSQPGSYTVTNFIASIDGCAETSFEASIVINELPTAIISGGGAICENETAPEVQITFTGSSPWDVSYTDGTNTYNETVSSSPYIITNGTAGEYSLISVSDLNCDGTTSGNATITINPNPIVSAGDDLVICSGEVVVLNGSGAVNYSWSGPIIDGESIILETGEYTFEVTGTDANGCSSTDQVNVTVIQTPNAGISATPASGFAPLEVTFTNLSENANAYNWNFGNGNSSESNEPTVNETFIEAGTYVVTLIANNGQCSDVATATIIVDPYAPLVYNVPNVFTPNNDGSNDIFHFSLEFASAIEVTICNRWGNVVGKINEIADNKGWDGNDYKTGKPLSEGVYFFIYTITDMNGDSVSGHGNVTLIRD